MTTLGAAVVGTGFIGPVHIEAIRRLGHRVVGVLGSTPEKSLRAAAEQNLPRGYSNYQELLADPAVDVVHITSPNREHFEQCKLALAAGKHLICEKPLAMTATETTELVKLAAKSKAITAVNYNVRFYPCVLELRDRIHSGQLGSLFHITGHYHQDWLLWPTDYNWRVSSNEGGALQAIADIGTHWLDTVGFATGLKVESVCADLQTVHAERQKPNGESKTFSKELTPDWEPVAIDTEDAGSVLIRFKGGARGCFSVSQVLSGRKNAIRIEVAGSKSSACWESEEPNSLHLGYREKANEELMRDGSLMGETAKKYCSYPGGHAEGFPDTFKQLFKAIYADIQNGKSAEPLYATFEDGHNEVKLCEAILQSHRERRWINL